MSKFLDKKVSWGLHSEIDSGAYNSWVIILMAAVILGFVIGFSGNTFPAQALIYEYSQPDFYTQEIAEAPEATPEPTSSSSPTPTPIPGVFNIGDRVKVTVDSLNVRPSPNKGKGGYQNADNMGTVIGGPVVAGEYTWWNIDFDSSPDGWAAEDWLSL